MRLIDADELKKQFIGGGDEYMDGWTFGDYAEHNIIPIIEEAPTIEAEPIKHGRWTQVWHGKLLPCDTTCCSVCGAEAFYDEVNGYYKSDYCPHCGAKMDEVTE